MDKCSYSLCKTQQEIVSFCLRLEVHPNVQVHYKTLVARTNGSQTTLGINKLHILTVTEAYLLNPNRIALYGSQGI